VLLLAAGCASEKTPAATPVDGGVDSAASPTACVLDGNQCRSSSTCCPPIVGRRFDLARHCYEADDTIIGCLAVRPQAACVHTDTPGCLERTGDDGGVELFWTSGVATALPDGAVYCPSDVECAVVNASPCAP
jgi:hypothetical protein